MKYKDYNVDVCVVGGGMAGICAALSSSRNGARTLLMQDRAVLGGNASSEIRMHIGGAHGKDLRESGIIEEIQLLNFYCNKSLSYSVWDSLLYGLAKKEKNLTLLLNTACYSAEVENETIVSVTGYQSIAETFHRVKASVMIDCSGDSVLAPLTNALYMYGRESKNDFDEDVVLTESDKKTMGMSCLLQIRETDHKTVFTPPDWAYDYPTDESMFYKPHNDPLHDNWWWIEYGGELDCVHDTDLCRDELLKIAYGVWDHMKNHGDHGMDCWELDFIGMLPGKRESRRYVGAYILTRTDVTENRQHHDTVAYAGWPMDDHYPEGFYHPHEGTRYYSTPSPWNIPYRCLYSPTVKNLMFAGRNISVTHAALSSSRVMATCSILGQAAGTAAALAVRHHVLPCDVNVSELQQILLEDDCYLPGIPRHPSPINAMVRCDAPKLLCATDRGEQSLTKLPLGKPFTLTLSKATSVKRLRMVLDSDLNRTYLNMPYHYPLKQTSYRMPECLLRSVLIEFTDADGTIHRQKYTDNHKRLVYYPVNACITSLSITPLETWGADSFTLYSLDLQA